jgi:hypothetical protein
MVTMRNHRRAATNVVGKTDLWTLSTIAGKDDEIVVSKTTFPFSRLSARRRLE